MSQPFEGLRDVPAGGAGGLLAGTVEQQAHIPSDERGQQLLDLHVMASSCKWLPALVNGTHHSSPGGRHRYRRAYVRWQVC